MKKQVFNLSGKSNGSYSDAVAYQGLGFISGQMSIDAVTGVSLPGPIEEEAKRAIENLLNVAKGLGAAAEDVLFVNVYLSHEADFDGFDAVYQSYFQDNLPGRVTVTVKELYDNLRIEITAVVALGQA